MQIVNIGVFAAIGRTFYARPELRHNVIATSSAVATSIALLSVEGYIAGSYSKAPRGQEGKRSREKGALIYRHLSEQIMRPQFLGILVGISNPSCILPVQMYTQVIPLVNLATMGAVGYLATASWKKKWDRRVVSAISIGLLTMAGGEG